MAADLAIIRHSMFQQNISARIQRTIISLTGNVDTH